MFILAIILAVTLFLILLYDIISGKSLLINLFRIWTAECEEEFDDIEITRKESPVIYWMVFIIQILCGSLLIAKILT